MGAEGLFIHMDPQGFPLWKSTSLVVAVGCDGGIQDGFQHTLNCKTLLKAGVFFWFFPSNFSVLGKSLRETMACANHVTKI